MEIGLHYQAKISFWHFYTLPFKKKRNNLYREFHFFPFLFFSAGTYVAKKGEWLDFRAQSNFIV